MRSGLGPSVIFGTPGLARGSWQRPNPELGEAPAQEGHGQGLGRSRSSTAGISHRSNPWMFSPRLAQDVSAGPGTALGAAPLPGPRCSSGVPKPGCSTRGSGRVPPNPRGPTGASPPPDGEVGDAQPPFWRHHEALRHLQHPGNHLGMDPGGK